ncbi:hypothetical protein PTKIN_Ptkin10aG0000800 [Pterospermum kingtungense]
MRVYIEIVVTNSIPKEIEVVLKSCKIVKVQVSIPWLPAKCMQCKVFGHEDKNCPKKAIVKKTKVVTELEKEVEIESSKSSTFSSVEELMKSIKAQASISSKVSKESSSKEAKIPNRAIGQVGQKSHAVCSIEDKDKGNDVVVEVDENSQDSFDESGYELEKKARKKDYLLLGSLSLQDWQQQGLQKQLKL